MKKTYTLILFLFASVFVFSQDLIVNNTGDSLNVTIDNVKEDRIEFTYNSITGTEIHQFLKLNDIKSYKFNVFQTTKKGKINKTIYSNNKPQTLTEPKPISTNAPAPTQKLRKTEFGAYFGYGKRLLKNPGTSSNYFNQVVKGVAFQSDLCFFDKNYKGYGIAYSLFYSDATYANI